jgi:23S rRNA (guanosine2251-2'-O)-methyltransferase
MQQITGSAPAPRIVRPQIPSAPAPNLAAAEPLAEALADIPADPMIDSQPEPELDLELEFNQEQAEAAQQLVEDLVAELSDAHPSEPAPELVLGLTPGSSTGFATDIQL